MVATGRWISTARIGMALTGLGCEVELMALGRHPARSVGVFRALYPYDPLRPLESVRRALEGAKADAVIPADELALLHLGELPRKPENQAGDGGFAELVRRSVGGAEVFAAAQSRLALLRIAESEGIAVPETVEVKGREEVEGAIARLGLPLVLKADTSSGGQGVRVARSAGDAVRGAKLLHRPPSLVRALKRGFVAGEWTHLRPWARRTTRGVTAQRFVRGRERTGMAMCNHGEVKAFVCLEVVETWCERGPSSVVQVIEDATMERAMRRIAGRLGVSGFCGFDFMVDEASGTPLLIEMNPRPTQLAHLPLGPGKDLMAAYVREILEVRVADRESATSKELIAVFPQEIERDGESPALAGAYHDVPWESPALIRRVLGNVPELLTGDARWRG
jgi:hypothetical protein